MLFVRVLVVAMLVALSSGDAGAVVFVVDTTTDAVDANPGDGTCDTGSGACALRAAIQEANALAGADDITLPAGVYDLTIAGPAEDLGASGDLDVHDTLTITGDGAGSTAIDGNGAVRVIEAGVPVLTTPFTTLTLAGLTITSGDAESGDDCNGIIALPGGDGVCANTVGLTLTDAAVLSSRQGVLAVGSLTVTRSIVAGNLAGGLQAIAAPALITDSTITQNVFGPGLRLDPSAGATIRNSTISMNYTTGIDYGGGCEPPQIPCDTSALVLENVTIVGHASEAIYARIGVFPGGGTVTAPVHVRNSYIAGNTDVCTGELISQGYNLFAPPGGDCVVSGDATGNVVLGTSPSLEPLAFNGGGTPTHALPAGNPAVNAGNPAAPGSGGTACLATDQRGVARPVGARCDIGAFESSCGDGVVDAGEVCETGLCCGTRCTADDDLCPACLACFGGTACAEPPDDCQPAFPARSTLKLDAKTDPTKRALAWSWKGNAVSSSTQFGAVTTPDGSGYELCLYAGGSSLRLLDAPAGCTGGVCWSPRPNGFQLRSPAGAADKVRVLLKSGNSGADLLQVKTKGAVFGFPSLSLALPARVRLERTDTGACWDATYDLGVSKNTPTQVRAKSD
jgi:CSLREA domain-containing protein